MPEIKNLLSHFAEESQKQISSIKEIVIFNQVELKYKVLV